MTRCLDSPAEPIRTVHSGPRLALAEHGMHYCAALGVWRRRDCNASASSQSTFKGLRSGAVRHCHPTAIQRWRAQLFFAENLGSTSES
eukprot:7897637-Pyramimonas_sp.AAC.1